MRITVVGAGSIGAAIVRELCARDDEVEQVQICDTRSRALQQLHDEVDHPSLRSFQVDARDMNVLSQIVSGSDCVISCVPSNLNPDLAELCLDAGVHFCDLGGDDSTVQKELALRDQAREKAVWIVPNCGLAPGLVNVLCLYAINQLDRAETASIRIGDVPLHPEPPFNFRISWSAERVIDDYTNPARLIENGSVVEVDALSRKETIHFDAEPFESMEAFCTQGGLSTLTDTLSGRLTELDHKTVQWPGHVDQMRFIFGLGLGEDRKIGVRTHLTYRDILVRRMRDRLAGDYEDAVLMRVFVRGEQGGDPTTHAYEMIERYDDGIHTSAMMRCTAIPTVVTALLLAREGDVTGGGANVPEEVVPRETFLKTVTERGLDLKRERLDGYRPITSKQPLEREHV